MDFTNFSKYLKIFFPTLTLSLVLTTLGSIWIDRLYLQKQDTDLLSFPDKIAQRAKNRKFYLFLILLLCISKAWTNVLFPAKFYYILAIAFLSFVTVTDFEQYVIFDSMLLPFSLLGLCYAVHLQLPLLNHMAAALGGGGLFFLLSLLTKGAIGGGDIKLISALGLWLGVKMLFSVIMYGAIAGGITALILLLFRKISRKEYLAYGPYFALSGIGLLLGWLKALF